MISMFCLDCAMNKANEKEAQKIFCRELPFYIQVKLKPQLMYRKSYIRTHVLYWLPPEVIVFTLGN